MRTAHFIIALIILPLLSFGPHINYISLTKIEYIIEKKSVQVTMKFFIDDMEAALEKRYEEPTEKAKNYAKDEQ